MDSSQEPALSANVAGLVDNASLKGKNSNLDGMPVYVKELIAGGFAGALSRTAVAPLERVKILWQNWPVLGSGPVIDLLAGSAAGGTSTLCTYPLDLARTKLAYQVGDTRGSAKDVPSRPAHNGIKGVLTSAYKDGGVRGLYRGVGPTLAGILPYAGLKFYMYEKLKMHVPEEHKKSILMRLTCGALAGLFGQTLTYPLDVVKRQMQVGSLQNSAHGDVRYRNTLEGLRIIVANQGWRQLFAGVSINYIRIVPSAAIGFTTYDMMKAWLGVAPQEKKSSLSVSAS
ncbi:mitochondrial carrier protein CoAc1 isoform X2 [Neltuma alba]|uniref:mitochondrial carrier protein CoAc1 isoform X2 n=1 Tax=Neltuma alba TaxID=207710 RepID=UPI0010A4E9BC|nr:mitochondrial carrier protein CoAc1 isoform X2 [Prosopis alba]